MSAFSFGAAGVRAMLPAMAGVLVLGILATVVPTLDWPLRGRRQGNAVVLGKLGMNVKVALYGGRAAAVVVGRAGQDLCGGSRVQWLRAADFVAPGGDSRLLLSTALAGQAVPVVYRGALAILSNTLRIVGICLAATHLPLPDMLVHEGIGVISYCITLWTLWGLARYRAMPEKGGKQQSGDMAGK